jgi:hypothetical protein
MSPARTQQKEPPFSSRQRGGAQAWAAGSALDRSLDARTVTAFLHARDADMWSLIGHDPDASSSAYTADRGEVAVVRRAFNSRFVA